MCHCVNGPGQFGCNACGAPGWDSGPAGPSPYYPAPFVPHVPEKPGWECPVCHRGNAPWIPYCHFCDAEARRAESQASA